MLPADVSLERRKVCTCTHGFSCVRRHMDVGGSGTRGSGRSGPCRHRDPKHLGPSIKDTDDSVYWCLTFKFCCLGSSGLGPHSSRPDGDFRAPLLERGRDGRVVKPQTEPTVYRKKRHTGLKEEKYFCFSNLVPGVVWVCWGRIELV